MGLKHSKIWHLVFLIPMSVAIPFLIFIINGIRYSHSKKTIFAFFAVFFICTSILVIIFMVTFKLLTGIWLTVIDLLVISIWNYIVSVEVMYLAKNNL